MEVITAFPELDERVFHAPRYRFIGLEDPWQCRSMYWQLATPGVWQQFTRDELRPLTGGLPFEEWLRGVLAERNIYCEAWIDDRWVAASWWRQLELHRETVRSEIVARVQQPHQELSSGEMSFRERVDTAASLSRIRAQCPGRKPQLGELAYHLIDEKGINRMDAMAIARQMGYQLHDSYAWAEALKNGRKRRRVSRPCRFCDNLPK